MAGVVQRPRETRAGQFAALESVLLRALPPNWLSLPAWFFQKVELVIVIQLWLTWMAPPVFPEKQLSNTQLSMRTSESSAY